MGKAWFAPKRYGYGASRPISWEGWAVVIAFIVGSATAVYLPGHYLPPETAVIARLAGLAFLVAALVLIARAKTAGGWRWRNGSE